MTATAWCLAVLAVITAALAAWATPRRYPIGYRPRRRLTARHTPAAIAATNPATTDNNGDTP